jgi:hypothetical protein
MSVYQIAVFDSGSASHADTLRATIERRLSDPGIRFRHNLLNAWCSRQTDEIAIRDCLPSLFLISHHSIFTKSSYFRAASWANRSF